jgi:hypothetical protein
MRRLLALMLVVVLGAAPAALLAAVPGAMAAGTTGGVSNLPGSTSPFSPGVPLSPAATPTATAPAVAQTPTGTSTGSGGLSGTNAILIAIGAVIVLTGIAYYIWRDARRHAPVRHAAAVETAGGRSGSKRPVKPRKLSPAERRRRKRGRAR